MTYYIAQMNESDLIEVVELEDLTRLSRWGYDGYRSDLLYNPLAVMLVARGEAPPSNLRRILGFIVGRVQPSPREASNELHIANVAIHPGFRRMGIAKRLIREALATGTMYGAASAMLEVRISNLPAQELYASLGFEVTFRKRAYYSFPVEDALIMERPLGGASDITPT
jgi:[ribosomal protein S18]-alanine N-acetyltransferase